MTLCPCGTGRAPAACCGRYHAGEPAPDAEALMRSRYSAYVLGDSGYLRATWHPDTCPDELGLDAPGAPRTAWLVPDGEGASRHRTGYRRGHLTSPRLFPACAGMNR